MKGPNYEATLEIDTTAAPISEVIRRLLEATPVADISVQDPPLEEVIARIYQAGKGGSS